MFNHHIVKNLLTGVISLALITPLALPINSASASAPKWLRIKNNRSQLMLSRPGHSRKIFYYRGKRGLKVRNRGSFSYHHKRYYRVSFKAGRKQRVVYILANQLNIQQPIRHHHRYNHSTIKHTKRNHHRTRVNKQTKNKAMKAPKMSQETWEVNSKAKPVKNINHFNKQVRSESLSDINRDRRTNHQKPLKQNKVLNKIANVRAKQLASNFSHYDGKQTYFSKDARRYGINANNITWGENLAKINYGNNPIKTADVMNNGYMNKDAQSGWSHRANILSPNYHYVGLGSYHDNQTRMTYQAEDFAG